MRTRSSLWWAFVCVLIIATAAVGDATAAAAKRMPARHAHPGHHAHRGHHSHRKHHSRRRAHVIGERAAAIARRMIGVPYVWGGASPSGFDCSGLVTFAYGRLGVSLPHSSYALFHVGRSVGRWALRPGDLVFFHGAGHVGVYIGKSRFVAAPHTGDHVKVSSLRDRWYADTYDGARRPPNAAKRAA